MSYDRSKNFHECAVPGCGVRISSKLLMCLAHWKRVPMRIRLNVSKSYRVSAGDYMVARQAAIDSVTPKTISPSAPSASAQPGQIIKSSATTRATGNLFQGGTQNAEGRN